VGVPWLHAGPFGYAGSIGPLPFNLATHEHWRRLGNVLAARFRLVGLFGVDAVMRDGVPIPVEINPRYTASVEILERSFGVPFLNAHRDVFATRPSTPPDLGKKKGAGKNEARQIWGKAVVYARLPLRFPDEGPWMAALQTPFDVDRVAFADIPAAGSSINAGEPILTVFASADDGVMCELRLQEKCTALDRHLFPR
jgi:predicted ATP-grasp superfamily ATP-dependent carboligase